MKWKSFLLQSKAKVQKLQSPNFKDWFRFSSLFHFFFFFLFAFHLKFSVHALSLFFSCSCQLFVFPPFNSFFHFFWSFYLHNIHENKRMKEIVFTNDRPKNVYLLSFRKLTSSRVTGRVPWCVTQSRIHWVTSLASHRSSTIDQNILSAAFLHKSLFCSFYLLTGVKFLNILCANFLCKSALRSFILVTFQLCNYLVEKYWRKRRE